jgi:hypothetical protein
MKYEATIHFEVKDEKVDLTDLIAGQKIDVHSVGLVGRTDAGEVASEMQRMWGGVVDWTPEAKVRIAEATKEISRRLEIDEETADRLWEGMKGRTDVTRRGSPTTIVVNPQSVTRGASPRLSAPSTVSCGLCLPDGRRHQACGRGTRRRCAREASQ